MKIKLFNPKIQLPEKKREGDAGWDIYLPRDVIFKSKEVTTIDLGFGIKLPEGYAGLFAMRSSVCREGLIMQMPLIDENYIGELHAVIYNPTDHDIMYLEKERVCSLFIFPVFNESLEIVDDLGTTNRGENRFGSSGR